MPRHHSPPEKKSKLTHYRTLPHVDGAARWAELFVNDDGKIVANLPDGSLSQGIEFGNSDDLRATLIDLGEARQEMASAEQEFNQLPVVDGTTWRWSTRPTG